jgi:hypothetical protein
MAGPAAVGRGWVYFTEVKTIPVEDLQTVRGGRDEGPGLRGAGREAQCEGRGRGRPRAGARRAQATRWPRRRALTRHAPPAPPCRRQVDALWRAASKGKFGYSVQKELFVQSARRWPKFFKQIDWTVGENNIYRKWPAEFIYSMDAVKGHLPLTNALRGTQLFQALLQHPAFDKAAGAKGSGIDERSKAAGANTLKF